MYKILIVDDERIERKGIAFLLKQMDIECVIDEAVNGQAALEYLAENDVDILLTDIKMPHMDGMEMVKKIKENKINPSMKIVIVSGHNDFEYAKLAVKLGVSDYILKPVNPEEFETTLRKIVDEIDSKKIEQDKVEKSKEYLRQHYLYSLVNGLSVGEMRDIKIDNSIMDEEYSKLMLVEFERSIFGNGDNDFLNNLAECLAEINVEFQYLNLNTEQCVIFFKEHDKEDAYWKKVATKIQNMIKRKYNATVYIAISRTFSKMEDIPSAFEETETLMENRFYQSETKIYISYEETQMDLSDSVDDDTIMKQMKQDIKMKDTEGLKIHFEKLCAKYKSKTDFSQVYVKFIFSNLLKDIYDNISEVGEFELNSEIEKLYKAVDFKTVIDIINVNIKRLEESFSTNPQTVHREVESVKQFIYEHYGEDLCVERLAEMVYMAPSYLSCVFKKETGLNLSKFIKAYRMEKAKEMLEDSHKKIVTISNEVGYPNVSYFCQSFREYFGISPQKFRSQGEV